MSNKLSFLITSVLLSCLTCPASALDPAKALDLLIGAPQPTVETFLAKPAPVVDGHVLNAGELRRFYALRANKPAWDTSLKSRAALKAFLTTVTTFSSYHGLQEDRYPSELLGRLIDSQKDEDSLKIELLLTDWLLRLAHELHGDTVNLAQLYPGWTFQRQPMDIAASLDKAVADNRVYDFIGDLAPTQPAYHRLARELKTYREMAAKGPWPKVTPGPTIRPGETDPRVAEVRARLAAENYTLPAPTGETDASINENYYGEGLRMAVENYQARNGLEPDGNVGIKTVTAMNVPLATRINQIMANMERWRHMPEAFPSRYTIVNIASTTVDIIDDGKSIYRGPVVAGRPDRKTPFMHSALRSVIFNPAWHVPAKIARKDILPKLRKDPHYLEKMGFVINGSADDPHGTEIDWDEIRESTFNFQLRQSPGDMNSLGRLKFDFDNNFAVYMHGTPHQELFDLPERHKSSGCVRLRDPVLFASIVLAHNEGAWSEERVQTEIDKSSTRWLAIAQPLPLFFVYWTVFPAEDDGPINFRTDVYNYDRFLLENLQKRGKGESSASVTSTSKQLI